MEDQLFQKVKNYLDITWDLSQQEIEKLSGMINRGKAALQKKIGACDFEGDTQEHTLLLCYVMYERAGALDEFWKNYSGEVIALQMERLVDRAEDQKQEV